MYRFCSDPTRELTTYSDRLLEGKLHVIQIGDSYDLWIGRERLWKENDKVRMELFEEEDQRWSCGKPNCKGHKDADQVCSVRWHCKRVSPPCAGHDFKDNVCATTYQKWVRDDYVDMRTYWSCGRAWPPCPVEHTGPQEICSDEKTNPGMYWNCRKLMPPCSGHSQPDGECPETIDVAATIRSWIREIQGYTGNWVKPLLHKRYPSGSEQFADLGDALSRGGIWLNPAEAALLLMAKFAKFSFLYGNHDNYMILPSITAGLTVRQSVIEIGSLFLEHGHRMEARTQFLSRLPSNADGTITGYDAAMAVYRNRKRLSEMKSRSLEPVIVKDDWKDSAGEILGWIDKKRGAKVEPGYEGVVALEDYADKGAKAAQQPQYWGEWAQVWLGRSSRGQVAPHIFVMGHTHCPVTKYIDIVYTA